MRVLDLSLGPVGGAATTVLADFGADVLKIERPGGDPFRALAASPLWLRGKRSAVLDLQLADDRARLLEHAREADVAVASFRPDRSRALGADPETLRAANPRLVYCAITAWGPRGPYAGYAGYEGLVAAKTGRMTSFAGQRDREGPVYAAVPVASHAAAQGAVQGICAALMAREAHGRGALVETSLLQAIGLYDLFQLLGLQLARRGGSDRPPVPVGGMPTLNYHPVMARDGRWIQLGNLLEHLFISFLDATELLAELIAEERFQGPPEQWTPEAVEVARDRILERMRERSADEWMKVFRENGNVAAEPLTTAQEALDHPDLVANGDIVLQRHPALGLVRAIGPIAQLMETPGEAGGPAPPVGAHGGFAEREAPPVRATADSAPPGDIAALPLRGTTIIDFSTIIAAPLGTSILADLGARVIKVEPIAGDPYRHLGLAGMLAVKTTAGKESLCLDLKSEAGREIVQALVRRCDAVVHNFRPSVPERLGIGLKQCRALQPEVVWVSANGYGPGSPSARRPATHPIAGAVAGGVLFQAGAGTPPDLCHTIEEMREISRQLMRANEPNPDPNTSAVVASATLLALLARQRHGVGQAVYVNMLAANAWANLDDFLAYEGKTPRPEVDPGLHGLGPLYRLYAAREGWVFLAAPGERAWRGLCEAARFEDLARDPRFENEEARAANADALAHELESRLAARDADAWEATLAPAAGAGVGCVRADATTPGRFLADDPHPRANGFAPECEHLRHGRVQRWPALVTVDGGHAELRSGVLAGEHTDAILSGLGYSNDRIAALRADGVVASEAVETATSTP